MMVALRNALVGNKKKSDGWRLCFTAGEANSTVSLGKMNSPKPLNLLYSYNEHDWHTLIPGETPITLQNVNDKVWLRAGTENDLTVKNTTFSMSNRDYYGFTMTGIIFGSGSLASLFNGEKEEAIPANTVFASLFSGCGSLVSSPTIPFINPARNSLATMFYRCSNLQSITVKFTSWGASFATTNWVNLVKSTGTFYCPAELGTNETISRGSSACPSNWTVVNI